MLAEFQNGLAVTNVRLEISNNFEPITERAWMPMAEDKNRNQSYRKKRTTWPQCRASAAGSRIEPAHLPGVEPALVQLNTYK